MSNAPVEAGTKVKDTRLGITFTVEGTYEGLSGREFVAITFHDRNPAVDVMQEKIKSGRWVPQNVTDCPYCGSDAHQVHDSHDDGGYRECDQGHTFHVDDWGN